MSGAEGRTPESPKPGDPRLEHADTTLIGGRHDAMRGAAREAARLGYRVQVIEAPIDGEARVAGPRFAREALARAGASGGPACIVASGETTVRVIGTGRGGRNQELALAAAEALAAATGPAVLASMGTDGIDGPTDAAGALVDSTTMARMEGTGYSLSDVLDGNNSYPCLESLGDLIRTGPTGTNVGDLQVLLLA